MLMVEGQDSRTETEQRICPEPVHSQWHRHSFLGRGMGFGRVWSDLPCAQAIGLPCLMLGQCSEVSVWRPAKACDLFPDRTQGLEIEDFDYILLQPL